MPCAAAAPAPDDPTCTRDVADLWGEGEVVQLHVQAPFVLWGPDVVGGVTRNHGPGKGDLGRTLEIKLEKFILRWLTRVLFKSTTGGIRFWNSNSWRNVSCRTTRHFKVG